MDKQFTELRRIYKTHSKVAFLLGISSRQYARIRAGEYRLRKPMAFMIENLLRVENLKASQDNK